MKTLHNLAQTNFKIFEPNLQHTWSLLVFALFSVALTAQKTYTVDDFFYRTVPAKSASAQVELFDQFLTGESAKFSVGEHHTLGNLNNRVTSLIVPEGLKVSLYFGRNYQGNKTTFLPGSYVSNWHSGDQWESMKVEKMGKHLDGAYFLQSNTKPTDAGWGGKIVQGLGPGTYDYLKNEIICNDCWTHLWVKGDVQVIVYDRANFDDAGLTNLSSPFTDTSDKKTGTMYDLTEYGYANNISSIDISLLNYGLFDVKRESIGTPEVQTKGLFGMTLEECNNNDNRKEMTFNTGRTVGSTKTVSTALATGTSIDFGITHTSSLSVGVEGIAEASVSMEVSTTVGASIEWTKTEESALSQEITMGGDNVSLQYGNAIMIEYFLKLKKQKYKETYFFRPLKPKPNSEGKFDFTNDAEARQKIVVVDVVEVLQSAGQPVKSYRKCTPSELGGASNHTSTSTSNNSGSTNSTSATNPVTVNTVLTNTGASTNTTSTANEVSKTINGRNVKVVSHSNGEFVQVDAKTWHEKDKNGKTSFVFKEVNRDDWSVYLFDKGRNTSIVLNLWKKDISYKNGANTGYSKLYTITASK